MVVQDEVTWVLDTIRGEWPGVEFPDTIARVNRDDPINLRTNEQSISVDLERFNAIHAASGSVQREVFGTTPQYRATTTVDVRVEAKPERDRGQVKNDAEFNTLVRYAQHAINTQLVYPEVDPDAEDIGRIIYLNARIQDEQRLASDNKDYYRTDFTVELRGNADTP